ncbi:MAG: hypothetical protein ACOX0Y_03210 [Thiopseudomonas sp.]
METLFCKCEDCGISVGLAEGQHRDDPGLCTDCSIKRDLAEIQELSGKPGYEGFPAPCDLSKLFPIVLQREAIDAVLKSYFEGYESLSEIERLRIDAVLARIAASMIWRLQGQLREADQPDS